MKYLYFLFVMIIGIASCKNSTVENAEIPSVPAHPVSEDQKYLTEAFIDSLNKNRQSLLIDFRRAVGFECVNLMDGSYLHLKIKVYPDGSFDDLEVLDREGVDIEKVRNCINAYVETTNPNFGKLRDLPSSGKTTNRHPHVYTLLIY